MDIEAPPRAQYIRTILTELSRIATIYLFLGEMGLQVGALTPAFWGFRDREHVLNLIEARDRRPLPPELQPHRRAQGRPAVGLDRRLPRGDEAHPRRLRRLRGRPRRQRDLRGPHPRHRHHPGRARRGLRRVAARTCARRASTGTCAATASRTSSYPELDFKVWTHSDGDSFARYWVRLQETRESARMVLQLLDGLPAGPIMAKVPAHHQGARGRGLGRDREPARPDGLLRRLEGRDRPVPREDPLRVASRNVSILPWLLQGVYVPDVITILGSACTSSSETSTADARRLLGARDRLGDDARRSRPSWSSPSSRWARSSSGTRSC